MAILSSPSLAEPLYECAPLVIVSGYVPGARVDIYATPPGSTSPARIGGGVSFSPTGQAFGVYRSKMVAAATLYATQTYSGSTSPPSPVVTLQTALSVDSPRLTSPLLECAECVVIDGMIPGSTAQIRDGATLLGSAYAASGSVRVGISPGFTAGHAIKANQVYCDTAGPESPGILVMGVLRGREQYLPAPDVQRPLYACQQVIVVSGCMPGAQSVLFINGLPMQEACSAGSSAAFWVATGLVEGDTITAQQQLCAGTIRSPVSAPIVVSPATDIPQPAIRGPLYEGDMSLVVAMTVAGEVVTIEANGTQIGMGGAGTGDSSLNIDPPLTYGQYLVAAVELCGVKKTSLPVLVQRRPADIPPPTITKPLLDCGKLVHVDGCLPGAKVRVYATAGPSVLIGTAKTFGDSITIDVTPLLQAGWQVTATQEVGGMTSAPSAAVTVKQASPPDKPRLRPPINTCAHCVRVERVLPGARVNVYQKGVWVGWADAWTSQVDVDVFPPLTQGATITATQTLCGWTSFPAKATVQAVSKTPPVPSISDVHIGASFVMVGNLVPGAMVEVAEVGTYNLVIGRTCATSGQQSIYLSVPLFVGAVLRAQQRLCRASDFSQTVTVVPPPEWPLYQGPFMAGYQIVRFTSLDYDLQAAIYYPATADGEGTPLAGGGPFSLIVFGHAKRFPMAGTPPDNTQDFLQLSGILSHLARWGLMSIAPDMSPSPGNPSFYGDAVLYMFAENTRSGSPFKGKVKTAGVGALGHSTGGLGAYAWANNSLSGIPVQAMGLIAPGADQQSSLAFFAPRPVLIIHGTKDSGKFGVGNTPLTLYASALPTKHLVTIDGANHFGYTDAIKVPSPYDGVATISQADQQMIAKAYLTAFFRRYLKGATEENDYLLGSRLVETLESFNITVEADP